MWQVILTWMNLKCSSHQSELHRCVLGFDPLWVSNPWGNGSTINGFKTILGQFPLWFWHSKDLSDLKKGLLAAGCLHLRFSRVKDEEIPTPGLLEPKSIVFVTFFSPTSFSPSLHSNSTAIKSQKHVSRWKILFSPSFFPWAWNKRNILISLFKRERRSQHYVKYLVFYNSFHNISIE